MIIFDYVCFSHNSLNILILKDYYTGYKSIMSSESNVCLNNLDDTYERSSSSG